MPWDVAVPRRRLSLWRLPFEHLLENCHWSVLAALMARPAPPVFKVRPARRVRRAPLSPVVLAPPVRPAPWACKV